MRAGLGANRASFLPERGATVDSPEPAVHATRSTTAHQQAGQATISRLSQRPV